MTWGRVTVRAGFPLLLAALVYFDTNGLLLWVALAAGLHELGHLLALWSMGGRLENLELSLGGIALHTAAVPALSYGRELAATLAGPLFSLLGALAAARLGPGFYAPAGIALSQGVFNLLPARTLDGGRALYLALCWRRDHRLADRALTVTTWLCAATLAAVGLYAFLLSGYNVTLLLAAGYAAATLLRRPEAGRQKIKG
ncbi:MAG: peptidase M50 [Oscillospiraceae bacterium]|jgi:Zn-dependent protease|nr:peptidase M50 [Oscillospiraceae bacterium]